MQESSRPKSPANQSSMKAGHNICWICPASEAPSGAGETNAFHLFSQFPISFP